MASGEIVRSIREQGLSSVSVSLVEKLESVPEIGGQKCDYSLLVTSYSGFEGSAFLIFLTINGASGDRLHPYYNLDRLSAGPLEGKLTTSQQVEVLRAALEQIAEIDPRVKGETGAPVARITKVGKEAYDVNFFKAMYQYVQEQASTTGH